MSDHVFVKNGITIPAHELEITTSRSGGPGGQYVNKTDSRITIKWNISTTSALTEAQKERALARLHNQLTTDGSIVVHNSASRSQHTNKENALAGLAELIRKALYVPKKRLKTAVPKGVKESRLKAKKQRGQTKRLRTWAGDE